MIRLRSLAWLSALTLTLGSAGLNADAAPINGGHGGGTGHPGVYHGGYGYRGYGYRGYGGYGYGWGWPWWGGVGFGIGFGYGYGYPYYGYPYYGYPSYGYTYTAYAPDPAYPAGPYVGPTLAAARGAPGTTPAGAPLIIPNNDVTLNVHAPADATIFINGNKTSQTGPQREFVSSGLAPGRTYSFDIRAQWTDAQGKPVDLNRKLTVIAGERRTVDFGMQPPPLAEISPPHLISDR